MQFLLTKEELDDLKRGQSERQRAAEIKLEALVTLAVQCLPPLTAASHQRMMSFDGNLPSRDELDGQTPHGCISRTSNATTTRSSASPKATTRPIAWWRLPSASSA